MYGIFANISEQKQANMSSLSAMIFILNMLATALLLRVTGDTSGD
jgi:hypothetical protein